MSNNLLNSPEQTISTFILKFLPKYGINSVLVLGTEYVQELGEIPILRFTNDTDFVLWTSLINQIMLCVCFLENKNVLFEIQRLSQVLEFKVHTKIVLVTEFGNTTEILELCWSYMLVNAVVIQKKSQDILRIFKYQPFPTFQVYESENSDHFPNKLHNLFGHLASFALSFDPPRKFKYFYKNKRLIGGYIWHFIETYCKKINVSLYEKVDYDELNKNPYQVRILAANGSLDFAPEVSTMQPYPNQTFFLEYITPRQIVPIITESEKLWYLFMPLNFHCWMFIIFSTIAFVILTSVASKIVYKQFEIIKNVLICIRLQLGQQSIPHTNFKKWIRLLLVPSLISGLFVNAAYNGLLGSFLTKVLPGKQINNFHNLRDYKMKMMVIQEEFDLSSGKWKPNMTQFSDVFTIERYETVIRHRDILNQSFGYIMPSDKWSFYRKMQQEKRNFIFREMRDDSFRYYMPMSVPVYRNSIYFENFQKYIVDVYSAGLTYKWRSDAIQEMSQGEILYKIGTRSIPGYEPLSLDYFSLQFFFLFSGFVVSLVAFCSEIFIFFVRDFSLRRV